MMLILSNVMLVNNPKQYRELKIITQTTKKSTTHEHAKFTWKILQCKGKNHGINLTNSL